MKYEFTKEQVESLANGLAEIPFKYAQPIIDFVRSICEPQTIADIEKQKQSEAEKPQPKGETSEK